MNESPQFPRPLGRYELVHLLGQGGMGEVFLAKISGAAGFEKPCIVKTILPTLLKDRQFLDRFHHEAKVLVHLVHSSIAQVYDMGEAEGTYYMALEYVAGVDLSFLQEQARNEGKPLPVPVALYLGQRIAEGLGYAHRKTGPDGQPLGIVHRDVSPHNVMVSYEGEVKVIDFGLAKSAARSKYTLPSTVMGKLGYMSPEQVRAEAVDHRGDIYSCAVVVWELLAGQPLIRHGTVGEMMAAMSHPTVPALHELRPDVDPALDAVVRRALAPSPDERYARADDFARALNEQLLRTGSSLGAEEVGDFVRGVCPEAFAAHRKLISRISNPDLRRTPLPGGELTPMNPGVPMNTGRLSPLPSGPDGDSGMGLEATLLRPAVVAPEPTQQLGVPVARSETRRPMVLALAAVGLLGMGAAVGVTASVLGRPSSVEQQSHEWRGPRGPSGSGGPPPHHDPRFPPPPPPPPHGAPRAMGPGHESGHLKGHPEPLASAHRLEMERELREARPDPEEPEESPREDRVREAGKVRKFVVLPEVAPSSKPPEAPAPRPEPLVAPAPPAPTAEKPAARKHEAEKLLGRVVLKSIGPFAQQLVVTNTGDFTWTGCMLVIRGRDKHQLLGVPPGGVREVPLSEFVRGDREVPFVSRNRVGLFCKEGQAEFPVKL
jgi:serine/threonine-protein kinase